MTIDIKSVGDVVLYLGAIATALIAVGALLRYVVLRPLKRWITEQVGDPVQEIRHEVTPNSGSSMKDDVAGVREAVEDLNKNLAAHIQATAPRDWRIRALEARLDEHFRDHPGPTHPPMEGT
ncbi:MULTISPECIES: hypothetical protein [unclassified Nonomuraea]|uniref:hypothetical protein n=1 Tax=unclassified Nonomuraea TaxID=2593643 RepID=UPI0033E61DE6